MKPVHRSLSGLVIAIVSVPVFMGLVACIPVGPMIGNPEKARIDPALTGLWIDVAEEAVVLFQPWDKRTWLVAFVGYEVDEENCPIPPEGDDDPLPLAYDELVALHESSEFLCFDFDGEIGIYKAWRTGIGGEWFMTWEMKGLFDEDVGYDPVLWLSFRERRSDPDDLVLELVDFSHEKFTEHEEIEAFEDMEPPFDPKVMKDASKVAERVIQRNLDDQELFQADEGLQLHRVAAEHLEIFEVVIGDAMGDL